MCGFEGNNLAELRADFGIFADTKHQELPGSSSKMKLRRFRKGRRGEESEHTDKERRYHCLKECGSLHRGLNPKKHLNSFKV